MTDNTLTSKKNHIADFHDSSLQSSVVQSSSSNVALPQPVNTKVIPRSSVSSSTFYSQEYTSLSKTPIVTVPTTQMNAEMAVDSPSTSDEHSNGLSTHPPSPSKQTPRPEARMAHGQKRTATGEVKLMATNIESRNSIFSRVPQHSRTVSADSNGPRIAELSAYLRTRLSYAAAKVEKSWQSRRHGTDPNISPIVSEPAGQDSKFSLGSSGKIACMNEGRFQRSYECPSISNSDPLSPRSSESSNGKSSLSSTHVTPIPRLAPPADIVSVSNSGDNRRRRPNPNTISMDKNPNPYCRHRRHCSEQDLHVLNKRPGPTTFLTPGTPPPRPSQIPSSFQTPAPSITSQRPPSRRTPSQNALMEQDAIETLLFMSSPENSGYHASSQNRQTSVNPSIESQMGSSFEGTKGTRTSAQNSLSSESRASQRTECNYEIPGSTGILSASVLQTRPPIGLEAQAGDDIDRLLDQMEDCDSDGEIYNFNNISRPPPLINGGGVRNGGNRN